MKKTFCFIAAAVFFSSLAFAETIKLNPPNLKRGASLMQALADRKSEKAFSEKQLALKDLSDLLWAANGINRADTGKRTAPSAMNRQDIKVYACMQKGVYLYDAARSELNRVAESDARQSSAPITLVLVSDVNDHWSPLDAGIVSQNISLFCSANGLSTYPHTTMDKDTLRKTLMLKDPQTLMMCNSVGYRKEK